MKVCSKARSLVFSSLRRLHHISHSYGVYYEKRYKNANPNSIQGLCTAKTIQMIFRYHTVSSTSLSRVRNCTVNIINLEKYDHTVEEVQLESRTITLSKISHCDFKTPICYLPPDIKYHIRCDGFSVGNRP